MNEMLIDSISRNMENKTTEALLNTRSKNMNRIFSSTMIVASALALHLGCGDKGTNPEDIDAGKFEAEVSGAVSLKLSGCASFMSESDLFFLGLLPLSSGQGGVLSLARGNGNVPRVGTYQIGEDAAGQSSQGFIGLFAYTNETFISQSGSLNVTSSAADRFAGSFTFTATSGSKTVTVSGKFNAKRGPCT